MVGGGLLRHHRGFLVGFQVMPVFAGLVTGSASALTSYLSSGTHGMVVHVKKYFLILPTSAFRIQARHHMEHATTYDTAKLKQAPGMVVHCERGHQLQSYVYRLHLLTLHPL